MKIVNVNIPGQKEYSYPIIIEKNLLEKAYEYIIKYTNAHKFLIVTNTKVYDLYGNKLKNNKTEFCILPDGEQYKTSEYLQKILDKALEIKLERKDAIIALGGGVIGDIAGFAAAICLRGIDFIQIPTTLLAQVDSSVGGKVAVNHRSGKNMIGAFYQPKLVLSDINTLNTLDERQFKTGMSEVIKYAFIEKNCNCIQEFNLLEFLSDNNNNIQLKNPDILTKMIESCCSLKSSVVNNDEKEKGLRAILNFGHTYAHAIENITNYEKYTHGEAVSIGMQKIFDLALTLEKIDHSYYDKAISLLNSYNLVTKVDFKIDKETFYNAMLCDKKVSGGELVFVIPNEPKRVEFVKNIDKKLILQGII